MTMMLALSVNMDNSLETIFNNTYRRCLSVLRIGRYDASWSCD